METEYDKTPQVLVMRRFFKALQEGNVMALELWSTHPRFRHEDENPYRKKLADVVGDPPKISDDSIEWLLMQAAEREGYRYKSRLLKPYHETIPRTRENNWRGSILDMIRKLALPISERHQYWMKLAYQLGWLKYYVHTSNWKDSPEGRDALFNIIPHDDLLAQAMGSSPELVDKLIEQGSLDISKCGAQIVKYYQKNEDGRKLVLHILQHRDRSKPMPEEVTEYLKELLQKYKEYEMVKRDMKYFTDAKMKEQ